VSLINNGGKFGQGSSTGATWSQGDYNYSGGVTLTDISLFNNAALYNAGSYLPVSGFGGLTAVESPAAWYTPEDGTFPVNALALVAVPEPSAVALAAWAALAAVLAGGFTRARR